MTWPGVTSWACAAAATGSAPKGACRLPSGLQAWVRMPSRALTARISGCGKSGCSSSWLSAGVTPVSSMTRVRCASVKLLTPMVRTSPSRWASTSACQAWP